MKAANTNNTPMRVPMAVMMMARKTLLMQGNARIAVLLERRFPHLRLSVTFQTSATVRP